MLHMILSYVTIKKKKQEKNKVGEYIYFMINYF